MIFYSKIYKLLLFKLVKRKANPSKIINYKSKGWFLTYYRKFKYNCIIKLKKLLFNCPSFVTKVYTSYKEEFSIALFCKKYIIEFKIGSAKRLI